jgi:hypothetical protein
MSGWFNSLWNSVVNCGCGWTNDDFCEWLGVYGEDSDEFRTPLVTPETPSGEAMSSIDQMKKKLSEEVQDAASTANLSSAQPQPQVPERTGTEPKVSTQPLPVSDQQGTPTSSPKGPVPNVGAKLSSEEVQDVSTKKETGPAQRLPESVAKQPGEGNLPKIPADPEILARMDPNELAGLFACAITRAQTFLTLLKQCLAAKPVADLGDFVAKNVEFHPDFDKWAQFVEVAIVENYKTALSNLQKQKGFFSSPVQTAIAAVLKVLQAELDRCREFLSSEEANLLHQKLASDLGQETVVATDYTEKREKVLETFKPANEKEPNKKYGNGIWQFTAVKPFVPKGPISIVNGNNEALQGLCPSQPGVSKERVEAKIANGLPKVAVIPVMLNQKGDLVLLDGHHMFAACMAIGRPVKFALTNGSAGPGTLEGWGGFGWIDLDPTKIPTGKKSDFRLTAEESEFLEGGKEIDPDWKGKVPWRTGEQSTTTTGPETGVNASNLGDVLKNVQGVPDEAAKEFSKLLQGYYKSLPGLEEYIDGLFKNGKLKRVLVSEKATDAFYDPGSKQIILPKGKLAQGDALDVLDALLFEFGNAEIQEQYTELHESFQAGLQPDGKPMSLQDHGLHKSAIEAGVTLKNAQALFALQEKGEPIAYQGQRNLDKVAANILRNQLKGLQAQDPLYKQITVAIEYLDGLLAVEPEVGKVKPPKRDGALDEFIKKIVRGVLPQINTEANSEVKAGVVSVIQNSPHKTKDRGDKSKVTGLTTCELYTFEKLSGVKAKEWADFLTAEVIKAFKQGGLGEPPNIDEVREWITKYVNGAHLASDDFDYSMGRPQALLEVLAKLQKYYPAAAQGLQASFDKTFTVSNDMREVIKARSEKQVDELVEKWRHTLESKNDTDIDSQVEEYRKGLLAQMTKEMPTGSETSSLSGAKSWAEQEAEMAKLDKEGLVLRLKDARDILKAAKAKSAKATFPIESSAWEPFETAFKSVETGTDHEAASKLLFDTMQKLWALIEKYGLDKLADASPGTEKKPDSGPSTGSGGPSLSGAKSVAEQEAEMDKLHKEALVLRLKDARDILQAAVNKADDLGVSIKTSTVQMYKTALDSVAAESNYERASELLTKTMDQVWAWIKRHGLEG